MRLKLRARTRAGVLAAVVVIGTAGWTAAGGGPAGTATLPGGIWGQPQAIPGLAALTGAQYSSGGTAISCASLGNCTAVGYYQSATAGSQPFAVTETDGTWGSAQSLAGAPGAPTSIGPLQKISCDAPGYCTASGSYGAYGSQAGYLATEVKGTWSVRTLPGTIGPDTVQQSTIDSVTCTGAGDCTLVGWYVTTPDPSSVRRAFTLDESGGIWGTPEPVAGLPPSGSSSRPTLSLLDSVSCSGPGDCTAGGAYDTGAGYVPFLVSESGGTWGSAQAVPGFAALNPAGAAFGVVTSVSCPGAAGCAVGGFYLGGSSGPRVVFTVDEVSGTWGSAKALDVPSQVNEVYGDVTVGCRAPGNCVVTGSMSMAMPWGTSTEVFAAAETSGVWGQGQVLPGIPAGDVSIFRGLSCVPGGDCTVAGFYVPTSGSPYQIFAAAVGTGGTIGAVRPVQPAGSAGPAVKALSCPQDGYCTLVENNGNAQLVTEANPASVTLTASAPQVSYGSEPAETFTATVSSTAGGTPTGIVTVTGPSGAACTITLAGGTGKCSFSPVQFPVGTFTATGSYSGDADYTDASGTAGVTVAKGSTATRLTPSAAVITFGQGAAETLTATVSHAGGADPAGTVSVRDGAWAVCTITLAGGSGSCTVNADQLIAHGYVLTAVYSGDGNFLASSSPPLSLTVARARPRLAWPLTGRPARPASRLPGRPAPPAG